VHHVTHFGRGFYEDGRLDPRFRRAMERLSKRPGWFVPVTPLLDYIQAKRGPVNARGAAETSLGTAVAGA